MKKSMRIFLIVLVLFCIGGLGSLFMNYIVFSKLVTHSKYKDNSLVKALSNKVEVTERITEKVVKDNESILTISAQASSGVVYVEEILPASFSRSSIKGGGIVMSGDGIIAVHESVFNINGAEGYKVGFFDGSVHKATQVYRDDFSGIIFLRVEGRDNLTAMPFANSSDAISGRKLINIYREEMSEQTFFNLGILSGQDYFSPYKQPSCDYLEGAFRVDFNKEALEYGLGGPMIDFNGEMVGMLAKNYKDEYFVITSNDAKDAFNRFLENGAQQLDEEDDNNIEDVKEEGDERVRLGVTCKLSNQKDNIGSRINYSVGDVNIENLAKDLGFKDEDLITQVDNYKVNAENRLSKILLNYKKGDVAKVKLLRGQEEIELDVNF